MVKLLSLFLVSIVFFAPASQAQLTHERVQQPTHLSGTWLLTGISFASGRNLDPSVRPLLNSLRLTISSDNGGSYTKDEPMSFGNDNKLAFSCRGTVTANFSVVRLENKTIFRVGPATDVPGKDCRGEAGKAKTDPDGDVLVVEMLSGDTLQTIDAAFNTDLEIDTYRRITP